MPKAREEVLRIVHEFGERPRGVYPSVVGQGIPA